MLISLITPNYNRVKLLEAAWQSLERQTLKSFEWIIVDNGSDKESLELLERIKKEASFRVVLLNEVKRGPSACRNTGLKVSSGDYIAYMDNDDALLPDTIAAWASSAGKFDIGVVENILHVYAVPYGSVVLAKDYSRYAADVRNLKYADFCTDVSFAQCVFKKSLVEKTGGWDEESTFREDIWFMLKICEMSPSVCFSSNGGYIYRKNSHYADRALDERAVKSALRFYDNLDKICLPDCCDAEALKRYIALEARSMWMKISLIYPDLGIRFKEYAQQRGVACGESVIKRKLVRIAKYPFRRFFIFTVLYYALRGGGCIRFSRDDFMFGVTR